VKKIILSLALCSLFTFGDIVEDYQSEAISAYRAGDYPKSLKNFKSLLEIQLKTLPKDSVKIADNYNIIGLLYRSMGDYPKALEYLQKSLSIREKILGKEHKDIVIIYVGIASVYQSLNDYEKALEYYQKSLIIAEKVLGKEHKYTTSIYHNIAYCSEYMLNYQKALEYYQKALVIYEKVLDKKNPKIAISYDNIGGVYIILGNYEKALEYLKKAMTVTEEIFGKEHENTATSYNNIGLLYKSMEDYPKALEYYKKSSTIREKVLGFEHPDTASSYNGIGSVYSSMGDYQKAFSIYFQALGIREKVLGFEHPDTAISYNDIGSVYYSMGDYPKALEYLQKSLAITEKVLGKEHPSTATNYNNIGLVYDFLRDYTKALEYHQKAMVIREKVLGKEHPDTAISYNNIGLFYNSMGDYSKAYSYSKKSFDSFLSQRDKVFSIIDTHGKEAFMKANTNQSVFLLKNAYAYAKTTPSKKEELKNTTFNDWLNLKGSVYDSENAMVTLYENTTDNSVKKLIKDLNNNKRAFAKLNQDVLFSTKNLESYNAKIKTLQDEISTSEITLSSKVASYQDEMKLRTISYKDVSKYLKEGELYIDFAYINGIKEYMVFAIDKQNSIQWFEIDEKDTKTINDNIETLRKEMKKIADSNKIYSDEMSVLNLSSKAKLQNIYKLLLEKTLGNSLKNTHSLVISADGLLRLLPFEAIHDGSNYLIENKEVRYIPSGKEFVRLNRHINKTNKTAVLIENPSFDYDIVSKKNMQTINTPNTHLTKDATIEVLKRGLLKKLSSNDANWTNSSFENTKIIKYDKNNATEANLIDSKQPRILHLSTHGFFINNESIKNPMLKSVIALAGANKYAKNGTGIVTALKLSGLDLEGTDLVVLSACQTGEIDANSTESISGLNRPLAKLNMRPASTYQN
jgi:tetratricopeptide (TPR) repeat protein